MKNRKIIIAGVGRAGCRIIDFLDGKLSDGVSLVAINTDAQSLAETRAITKIQIGSTVTNGLGTGGNVETGKRAAQEDAELIRGLFTEPCLFILATGLGCGTGSGAAPIIADLAKESGALTMCFVTLPFKFEGEQRMSRATEALHKLRSSSDFVVFIPNDRLFEASQENDLKSAFQKADEVVGYGISAVWRLFTKPGYLKLDFADIEKVAEKGGGTCSFAYGEGKGQDKAKKALNALLSSPLLDGGKIIASAKSIVVSIVGGSDVALKEIGEIMDGISAKKDPDALVCMGTVVDENWHDRISVAILASEYIETDVVEPHIKEPVKQEQRSGRKKKSEMKQAQIEFQPSKGRFKGIEPTIFDGQDLDIPTFVRRGVQVDK